MNDIELFSENELSPIETEEREFHEQVVDDVKGGIEKLASIGDASLKVLRDKRLYRTTHKTFEDYCQERFGFERRYANRQIFYSGIQELLGPRGPKTEYQSRPLVSLPTTELQAQAWTQAQAVSGKEQPSNREVGEVVEAIKAELEKERQRNAEWAAQNKANRDKIRALELDLATAQSRPVPEPEKIEVIPPDYETAKAKAAQLERELEKVKKEQDKLINSQVKAKLHEYQSEVNEMEQRKAMLEDQVKRMKDYLASLEGEARRLEVHQQVIEELRLKLISLAAFLSDEEPVQDADTVKRWRALSDMLGEATAATRQYAGDAKPSLTVIRGDAA